MLAYKNIQKKADGSYVLEKNGMPYHVPNTGEFAEEYEFINKYVEAYPEEVTEYQEPVVEQAPVDKRLVRLAALEKESNELSQDILADIATNEDKARFKDVRSEIKAIKAEIEAEKTQVVEEVPEVTEETAGSEAVEPNTQVE